MRIPRVYPVLSGVDSSKLTLRLRFGAEHALCGGQYCATLDAEQGSVLCDPLGWQAGGLLCAPR